RKEGVDIAGATNATYRIDSVSAADTGTYCVVVTGPCLGLTNCAALAVLECMPLTSDNPTLDLQSGLLQQKARISHPTDVTLSAVRVSISDLSEGAQVYNASGDADGVPYVKYNQPLGAGEAVELSIEYYVADRRTPASTLCAHPASSSAPTEQDGEPVTIDRVVRLADGTRLIEFTAVPDQVYYIQYGEDFRTWKTVTPSVTTKANRIQWIDNGQPKTDSLPSERPSRFYRVITSP